MNLRALELSDAPAWLAGEDEEQRFTLDGPAEPWEHAESGTMLRYVFSPARS